MADTDGSSLSLADYIKVKRKQGGFKVGRGGAKARPQSARGGKGRAVQQRQRGGQNGAGNQGQQQQRRNRQGGIGRFNNKAVISPRKGPNVGRKNQRFRGFKNRQTAGQRNRLQRQQVNSRNSFQGQNQGITRGVSQHLMRGGRRGAKLNRTIQPLMNVNRNARNRSQLQLSNQTRGIQYRANNRRAVLKLAQKRIQRARLQLARPRIVTGAGRRSLGKGLGRIQGLAGLISSRPGIKVNRSGGLVTVRSPVEKQLQRLVIQDKIKRARQARNRNQNQTPNRVVGPREAAIRVEVPNNRRRRYQQTRQREAPPVRRYDPYEPMMGTMYADELAHGSGHGRSVMRRRESYSPPIVRTATNNAYRERSQDEYDFHGLNPEIQKKISFIQNRNRVTEPPPIIPDFRAPIQSSTIKLGDRFRMYSNMQ